MIKSIFRQLRSNLSVAKFDRQELSGSLGDLGTFLPIILGLAFITGLSFSAMLFWAGAFNLLTGLIFTIPMPVQPMKAIAAVAISEGMTANEVYASGLIMAAMMLLVWVFNIAEFLNKIIPKAVVRGIQLTIGIKLFIKGSELIYDMPIFGYDSILVGSAGVIFVLLLYNSNKIPTALILFIVGISLASIVDPDALNSLKPNLYIPQFIMISLSDFSAGFISGALPQLPLTMLNSVIAVSALSFDHFPKRGAGVRKISLSVGLMNIACLFGAMPMCHGSGGLAAQKRFGARTNGSIIMLGAGKMLLAIVFGASMLPFFRAFPESILGALLIIAGIELGSAIKDQKKLRDYIIVIIVAAVSIATGNLAIGFISGTIAASIKRKKL